MAAKVPSRGQHRCPKCVFWKCREKIAMGIISWLTSARVAGKVNMKLHHHVAADIIGPWWLLQKCSLHVFQDEWSSLECRDEGRMQGCRSCRRAQPLCRITTPASSALADGCEHRYAVYSNLSRYRATRLCATKRTCPACIALRDDVSTCASRDVYICRLPSCLLPTAHLKGDRSSKSKATCK